jgi:predicted TIM-barrel fold metal-dependent hydrolase
MAKRRRRRRVCLGAPEADHHRRASAFALEALRYIEKAKHAPDCRTAFDQLGKAHRAYGGTIAEASAMEDISQSARVAVHKIAGEIEEAHNMIAGRCLRGGS